MRSLFFIPVWNQIRELPGLISELKSTPLPCTTLLFVNNGSDDGSETMIRESGFQYIELPKNLGIGHSFMKALDWALERDYEVFGVLAGNGKMLPQEMGRVLDPVINGEADYVTGSRFLIGGDSPNLPGFRKSAIPMVNTMVKLLYGVNLTDATCGYKAMKIDLFRRANFDWHHASLNTYGFEYYVYGKVLRDSSIRWKEVPITMRYPEKGSYSKIKPFSGWYQMLKPWVMARIDSKGFNKASYVSVTEAAA